MLSGVSTRQSGGAVASQVGHSVRYTIASVVFMGIGIVVSSDFFFWNGGTSVSDLVSSILFG